MTVNTGIVYMGVLRMVIVVQGFADKLIDLYHHLYIYILSCLMIGWGLIRMLWHKIEITLSFILTFLMDKSLL